MKRHTLRPALSNRPMGLVLSLALSFSLFLSGMSVTAESATPHKKSPHRPAAKVTTPAKKPVAPVAAASNEPYVAVSPIDLLKDPKQYLNKRVTFDGVFSSFSSLGLDYKKAMRDSKDYVSFLIRRPDVASTSIPLSELKLIFPRKKSDDVLKLEAGDKISVKGQVYSTALNEPWLDITDVKVLEKVKSTKPAEEK